MPRRPSRQQREAPGIFLGRTVSEPAEHDMGWTFLNGGGLAVITNPHTTQHSCVFCPVPCDCEQHHISTPPYPSQDRHKACRGQAKDGAPEHHRHHHQPWPRPPHPDLYAHTYQSKPWPALPLHSRPRRRRAGWWGRELLLLLPFRRLPYT